MALHAPLDAMVRGLEFTGESNELVVSLSRIGAPLGQPRRWPRLISLDRWLSADWDGPMPETRFPQVTVVQGHFVVSRAVGGKAGRPDMIRYWDPLDARIRIETVQGFAQAKSPDTVGSVARG
ncbi:hypothetical protein ACEZDB_12135 [Streptacidiphilus sp. N1-3]|uniref:Uncharacterized protein n=1 Tax=Streptacidiphilus alkalitolerans TaxID=3342712 RepID=A0ABV6WZK4_9ACTN